MLEEMHHITKAVGFTGNTIKRWLATSPQSPPNADQTLEMAEPTTPVRLRKVRTLQFDEFEVHSNAPRKRSITILLSSSRTGSLPSSFSDEPRTPTKSPKIGFKSSVDGTIFPNLANMTGVPETDNVVDASIRHPVLISVHVVSGQLIHIHRAFISLDSSRKELTDAIASLCVEWRAKHSKYMTFLESNGKCIHMLANIQFGDHRDIYVGGNEQGCYRFKTLRDFFTNEELYFLDNTGQRPCITVLVNISAEGMTEDEGICEYPDPYPKNTFQRAYHRIASWPYTDESTDSQHLPLRVGLYGPYNRLTGEMCNPIEVLERPINDSLTIGNFSNPKHHQRLPPPTSFEPQYQRENLCGQPVQTMIHRNVLFNVMLKRAEPNIPTLPAMTFNEYRRPAGHTNAISNEPIHLAVRIVNALPRQQNVHLPSNVLMKVTPGKGTKAAIHTALTNALYNFGKKYFIDSTGIGQLFREEVTEDGQRKGVWAGHRLDLWVLPQKGDHRMYVFERGSLKWFLDAKRAKEGDRRLYVEAWILPKDQEEVSWETVSDGSDQ